MSRVFRDFPSRSIELEEFAYRSVVLFTNSPFHRPHVSSRAVAAKNNRFTASRKPMGPKKYARISMSPVKKIFSAISVEKASSRYREKYLLLYIRALFINIINDTNM